MAERARVPEPHEAKLSAELRRRLERMAPGRSVRAVVLLETATARPAVLRSTDRQEAIGAVRDAARSAKLVLDPILSQFGGRWLSEEPDTLGSLGVEAPVAGLLALAGSDRVRAILEDQRISGLPRQKR